MSNMEEEKKSLGEAKNRVYVGNLSWEVTSSELRDVMSTVGTVISADILEGNNGRSRGCGLVEFSSETEAQRAISELTDIEVKGRKIFVREDRGAVKPVASRPSAAAPAAKETKEVRKKERQPRDLSKVVIVSNLPLDATWQDLKDFMRSAGEVARSDVVPSTNGDNTAVGTVEFKLEEGVVNALALNGTAFRGSEINVRVASEEDNDAATKAISRGKKVFVGQLAWSVAWQDLKDHFKPMGTILRADVATENGSRRSKGFGFIEFQNAEDAEKAIKELNDSVLHGRRIHVREDRVEK